MLLTRVITWSPLTMSDAAPSERIAQLERAVNRLLLPLVERLEADVKRSKGPPPRPTTRSSASSRRTNDSSPTTSHIPEARADDDAMTRTGPIGASTLETATRADGCHGFGLPTPCACRQPGHTGSAKPNPWQPTPTSKSSPQGGNHGRVVIKRNIR